MPLVPAIIVSFVGAALLVGAFVVVIGLILYATMD
jgi:hypothetical protein